MLIDGVDIGTLIDGKEEDELRFVGCILNDMTLLSAVDVNSTMIYTEPSKTLYRVISNVYENGFEEINRHSVSKVLQDVSELMEAWEEACLSIDAVEILAKEYKNIEEDIFKYFDIIKKNHIVIRVYVNNIKTNVMLAEKSGVLSVEDMRSVVEYTTNDIFLDGVKCNEKSLQFTSEHAQRLKDGEGIGIPYGLTYMSKRTSGLHLGGLNVLAGSKGTGKSTIMLCNFVMSCIDEGEEVVLVSNEMTVEKIQNILIPFILATKFKDFNLSRTKFLTYNLKGLDETMFEDAQEIFNLMMERVTFIELLNFTKDALLSVVRKYAKQGKKYFFFDTFKSNFENADNLTTQLMNTVQKLSQECIDLNVFGLATMQLKTTGKHRRYLDDSALARCTEVGQDLDMLWLVRDLFDDEYNEKSHDIKTYRYDYENGVKLTRNVLLKDDRKYIAIFLDKNRFGETGLVTVAEKNTAFGIFNELGYGIISDTPSFRSGG